MFTQAFKQFFCSQAIYFVVFISLFDLIAHWWCIASLSMSNLTNNKRNKRLQKFNGSYQALTEVNLVR